jgi:two-component system response regulator MprA
LATRICVIDDDASFRKLCEAILSSEGFSCEFIEDPTEAPAVIVSSRPDLVIMDLRLGGEVDGVAVLLAIKEAPSSTTDIPVLICSASTDLIEKNRALLERLGCEVLDKPFGIDDLLAAIERCLAPIREANGAHKPGP